MKGIEKLISNEKYFLLNRRPHVCAQASLCPDTFLLTHVCALTYYNRVVTIMSGYIKCLGTEVRGHSRVVTIMYGHRRGTWNLYKIICGLDASLSP